jgi:hypothetical protein
MSQNDVILVPISNKDIILERSPLHFGSGFDRYPSKWLWQLPIPLLWHVMISSTSSRLITPFNHHVSIILPCVWRSQAEIVESEFYQLNHKKENSTNNMLSSFIIYVSYQANSRCVAELKVIWGFPKIRLPQNNHPFYLRMSHEINHPKHPAME